jgi:hypothetical protein
MDLTADQFATVIASFSEPSDQQDKRRAERVVHQCVVPIVLGYNTPEERQAMVTVRDLSPRGVGLISSKPLPRGEQFVLQLNGPGSAPSVLLCTVAHCSKQGKKAYAIGAEFTCILDEARPTPETTNDEAARIQQSMLS